MSQLITVTFDGNVLTPKKKLDLDINKEYQIELVNLPEKNVINDLEVSAQLYAEIYKYDQELRELTQVSCIDFIE